MLPHVLEACPDWAVESAAAAPRISPADAAPLLALLGQARPAPLAVAA